MHLFEHYDDVKHLKFEFICQFDKTKDGILTKKKKHVHRTHIYDLCAEKPLVKSCCWL